MIRKLNEYIKRKDKQDHKLIQYGRVRGGREKIYKKNDLNGYNIYNT